MFDLCPVTHAFILTVVHFSMMPPFMQNNNSIKFWLLLNDPINISDSWLTTLSCASAGSDWISRTRRIRLLAQELVIEFALESRPVARLGHVLANKLTSYHWFSMLLRGGTLTLLVLLLLRFLYAGH